jgi:hypothetical protein
MTISQRKIRLDPPAPLQGALRTDGVDTSWTKRSSRGAIIPDLRREERYTPVNHWAWLGWWRWCGFRTYDALVINISRGGALVFLDEPPPLRRSVCLFIETPDKKITLKAKTLENIITQQGQCAVRLQFRQPPPLELFDVAVCGLSSVNPKRRAGMPPPEKAEPSGGEPESLG